MKIKITSLLSTVMILLFESCAVAHSQQINKLPDWVFGSFSRPLGIYPITPFGIACRFLDPMTHQFSTWEANSTFNPDVALKDGKIVELYRLEDKTGLIFSTRTSRIGYFRRYSRFEIYKKEKGVHVLWLRRFRIISSCI